MDGKATLDITLDAASAAAAAEFERQELLQKIATLEQRLTDLETSTVLSEPETRVRRVEVYVDPNWAASTTSRCPGAKKAVTYLRERTYRRQTISEKIDAALEDAAKHSVTVGVDAAMAHAICRAHPGRCRSQQQRLRPGVGGLVLHGRDRAEHVVLRRHRRLERGAARQRNRDADAHQRLHRATDRTKLAESA